MRRICIVSLYHCYLFPERTSVLLHTRQIKSNHTTLVLAHFSNHHKRKGHVRNDKTYREKISAQFIQKKIYKKTSVRVIYENEKYVRVSLLDEPKLTFP